VAHDTFNPQGDVPAEEFMTLRHHYRIVSQAMTSWGLPKTFPKYTDLGATTEEWGRNQIVYLRDRSNSGKLFWLERSLIGTEVWERVSHE